jgi:hypothetical protein
LHTFFFPPTSGVPDVQSFSRVRGSTTHAGRDHPRTARAAERSCRASARSRSLPPAADWFGARRACGLSHGGHPAADTIPRHRHGRSSIIDSADARSALKSSPRARPLLRGHTRGRGDGFNAEGAEGAEFLLQEFSGVLRARRALVALGASRMG